MDFDFEVRNKMNFGRKGIHKQKLSLNATGTKWARKFILLLIEAFLAVFIGGTIIICAAGIGLFNGILADAPEISTISVTPKGQASFVYDSDGHQIQKLVAANANRIPVSYDKIPIDLEHAFVAIEDERFYTHNGIDIQGIVRAGFVAVKNGDLSQGASTITQQLVKNNVFTSWVGEENTVQKIKRKIQEQATAIRVEKEYSKSEIMTSYLNTINLGHNTLGVQAASKRYFGKDVSELNLSECAVIAAITQNPSKFNPILHPDENASRRKDVLNNMLRLGYIDEKQYEECLKDNVYSRISSYNEENAETSVTSYFVDALTEQLFDDLIAAGYSESAAYGLMYSGGLKIYSTMDSRIQAICDEECSNPDNYPANVKWLLEYRLSIQKPDGTTENHSNEMVTSYFKSLNAKYNGLYSSMEDAQAATLEYQAAVMAEDDEIIAEEVNITPQPQISFTVEDQHNGYIVAMVGGRGSKSAARTFNRATQSTRQPGSCFKVLSAFAPALDTGLMSLATTVNDAPFNYKDGTPVTNWYGKNTYNGLQTIRKGVWYSLNVVAVKTITWLTPEVGFDYLINFGFTTLHDRKVVNDMIFSDIGQPLALGGITDGILNVELNSAYAAIANGGEYIKPKYYTKVVDSEGNVILDNTTPEVRQVIKPTTAWLMTDAMKDCISIGTGTGARRYFSGQEMAGKTGTTSSSVDLWFAAYTPYYTASCWSGYDNNKPMNNEESGIPQKLWSKIMGRVHEGFEHIDFEQPEGLERVTVCSRSGLLPIPGVCDGCLTSEWFDSEYIPTEYCNVHYRGNICGYDNLPATEYCPFCYQGTLEMSPPEDLSLKDGSEESLDMALDPLSVGYEAQIVPTVTCHHNEQFFMQPGYEEILAVEQAEYAARVAAVSEGGE